MNAYVEQARQLIKQSKAHASREKRIEDAIALTAILLKIAKEEQCPDEKQQQLMIAHLMENASGKLFITELTDQCFRTENNTRIADQIRYVIQKRGIPKGLPFTAGIELKAFSMLSKAFPSFLVPFVKQSIRKQVASVVVPGEPDKLKSYLDKRKKEGFRINLNYLGEAILGETEAQHRLNIYLNYLQQPEIDYISIKPSSIYSQINLLAWDKTLKILTERLRTLFKSAHEKDKFVNFDMEEYRDLAMTVEVFKKILDEPEFLQFSAGIALQSYIPDSHLYQQELTQWALNRVSKGGAPIKIRIVKGANLAMERVEASLKGWELAPYKEKWETDTNFIRMVDYALKPEHAKAVHIGIGSHNLFDISYALLLRAETELEKEVIFEMLEGMAPHISRAVKTIAGELLLYSPAVEEKEFHTALAYLMRRLDENTAPENFLHALFSMNVDTNEWHQQAKEFKLSCEVQQNVKFTPNRNQNRGRDTSAIPLFQNMFHNEPDTDWSQKGNRKWIETVIKQWEALKAVNIPLSIGGKAVPGQSSLPGIDPSRPEYPLYTYQLAGKEQVDQAVEIAKAGWKNSTLHERSGILQKVADELRRERGNLIGAMTADGGKTINEADAEVSEAIDFCEYYRRNAEDWALFNDIEWQSKGAVAVIPPWNFPCAIPVGGIAAALAAGNAVIFKPAAETVLVAWTLVQAFWRAGVPQHVLQFITGEDETTGTALIQHPQISAVILTGGTATAQHLLKLNPHIHLCAETGGKNSIIVTQLADRDLAIKDIIQSAFSHSGQKCSACSLLILLPEVYDDPKFKENLRDATASLTVGSAWDPSSKITPLIRPPIGPLLRGLTEQALGEEWVLQPNPTTDNPYLWSPGIKWGVTPDSYSYQNELFGPVLSVMRANDLEHAIKLANGTPYGLTAGIHSLDDREVQVWAEKIQAGNLYVNRSITGAIVSRQPFGGTKQSSFGPGLKAGGPNYLTQLFNPQQRGLPNDKGMLPDTLLHLNKHVQDLGWNADKLELWNSSLASYAYFQDLYFNSEHDPVHLMGQDNLLKYVPRRNVIIRIQIGDDPGDVLRLCAAGIISSSAVEVSLPPALITHEYFPASLLSKYPSLHFIAEDEGQLAHRMKDNRVNTVRYLSKPTDYAANALANNGCAIFVAAPLANGRLELLHFLREIALSIDYHRYGYLGDRAPEITANGGSANGICCGSTKPCCGGGYCDETG
ncbi:MAG: proline dehydrogenase family protein [Parachlamydiales bacterium]|jgi:RHH-type proline utilization regulon transcriptional repressor/proline dehydrogenase/delta 1-pyrroline-5-carboxylate dehydrogenase